MFHPLSFFCFCFLFLCRRVWRAVMEPRRSQRKRASRYIKVDGYSILKLNNYSLEEGEQSVYTHEARASAPIHLPKAKNAFQLFAAAFKQDNRCVRARAGERAHHHSICSL